MSIKLTKRIAAEVMKRGVSAVRISDAALEDAKKAITREDVKALVKSGKVYAVKEKEQLSLHGKDLKARRDRGRGRGPGKRKGKMKARQGIPYQGRVRSQRRILKELKDSSAIDNAIFSRYYRLVKGGTFQTKISLINHIKSSGVKISDEDVAKLRHI